MRECFWRAAEGQSWRFWQSPNFFSLSAIPGRLYPSCWPNRQSTISPPDELRSSPSFYFCALDRYASGASRIQQGKSRSSGESIAQTFQLLDVKNRRLLIFFFFYYFFGLLSASFLSSRSLFIGWSRKTRLTRCYSFESNDYLFLFLLPC